MLSTNISPADKLIPSIQTQTLDRTRPPSAPPRPAPPGWYLDNLYNLRHVQTFLWLGVCYNLYIYLGVVCCVVKQSSKIILYLASKGNLRSLQTSSRGPVTIILQNYCSSWKLGSGCATFCASSAHPRWCPVFWVKSGLFRAKILKLLIITNKFPRETACETEK